MKKISSIIGYTLFFNFILLIDMLTKQWALLTAHKTLVLNRFFSLELLVNRGISWGIFHHADQPFFIALSVAISLLVVLLIAYTVSRFMKGFSIYAELLVIAGACGNLIDRAMHKGVIDFVVMHLGPLTTPVFNVADVAIIIGVICMFALAYE